MAGPVALVLRAVGGVTVATSPGPA